MRRMPTQDALPNLATNAPLWLALLTVGVNALVGALRGHSDDSRHWDIVGVAVFALLMGLGGGFIRDMLLGNLPATSLRDPWSLATVLLAVGIVLVIGHHLARAATIMSFLDALAIGLFAVTGTEYGLAFDLPYVSAILLGAISAVGGGMLVSVLQGQTPEILLAGAPTALLAVAGSVVYAVVSLWSPNVASVLGIAVVVAGQYAARRLGIRTRPTGVQPAQ
jgi:uncharacterized membrane protein YeiH